MAYRGWLLLQFTAFGNTGKSANDFSPSSLHISLQYQEIVLIFLNNQYYLKFK